MKILVVKTSALGDIVHVFPAIHLIKEHFPHALIDWVVEKKNVSLVASNPYINRAIAVDTQGWRRSYSLKEVGAFIKDLRQEKYDLVLDFQGNLKSGLITGLSKGHLNVGFDWNSVSEKPNWFFTNRHAKIQPGLNAREEYLALVEKGLGIKPIAPKGTLLNLNPEDSEKLLHFQARKEPLRHIMVCPGSLWPNKKALKEDLSCFLRKIPHAKYWFLYGNAQEKQEAVALSSSVEQGEVIGELSFSLLQHVMKEMSLVIAMDSFPLHLAGEAEVPTFSIFGASASQKFAPLGKIHRSFQGECPYGQTFVRRCPYLRTCKTGACIHSIPENALYQAFSLGENPIDPLK